ncbi:MAG: cytochrome-c oxidase, cbb3-type subunit III, partial [Alphaproteobacteria bacterium]|nr:cytochrome-c oxidase, cbb3-type subunit III [Alphaproteobacteria bacterium]
VWDGIKELNTPLPKWWVNLFWLTVIWGLGYMIVYPSLPHVGGLWNYWSRGELAESLKEQRAQRAGFVGRIEKASLTEIRRSDDLRNFAFAGGRQVFADNCAPCHGSGGAGTRGYPSLADDDWLWGGTLEAIEQTIRHGVRNADDKSRVSQMPRFGVDGVLTSEEIADTADFVLALAGAKPTSEVSRRGEAVYKDHCVACHGDKGEGNLELGAPRLNDGIWLYGGDRAAVIQSISASRAGSMPGWDGRLDAATIKMLTVYVHALGGGK